MAQTAATLTAEDQGVETIKTTAAAGSATAATKPSVA